MRVIQCITVFFKNLQLNMPFYTLAFLGLALLYNKFVFIFGVQKFVAF